MKRYSDHENPSTCELLPLPLLRRLCGEAAQIRAAFEELAISQPSFSAALSLQLDRLVQAEESLTEWIRARHRLENAA